MSLVGDTCREHFYTKHVIFVLFEGFVFCFVLVFLA